MDAESQLRQQVQELKDLLRAMSWPRKKTIAELEAEIKAALEKEVAWESKISEVWASPDRKKLREMLGRLLALAHEVEAFLAGYPGEGYPK